MDGAAVGGAAGAVVVVAPAPLVAGVGIDPIVLPVEVVFGPEEGVTAALDDVADETVGRTVVVVRCPLACLLPHPLTRPAQVVTTMVVAKMLRHRGDRSPEVAAPPAPRQARMPPQPLAVGGRRGSGPRLRVIATAPPRA